MGQKRLCLIEVASETSPPAALLPAVLRCRRAFNLPEDSELNITFTCDEPTAGVVEEPQPPPPTWGPSSETPHHCCGSFFLAPPHPSRAALLCSTALCPYYYLLSAH